MRKIIITLLLLMVFAQSALAADTNIFVNGRFIDCDSYVSNGTTYVPLRAVSEAMGASVAYSDGNINIDTQEDNKIASIVESASESMVAIAGNYTADYISKQVQSYHDTYAFGTGIVIKSGGVILTNYHVVKDIENITVILGSGQSYAGSILYFDEEIDLAVLKINALGLKPVIIGTNDDIKVGQSVIAIGTPLSLSYQNSVTKGIISGKDVIVKGKAYHYTQSDVAINGGNSGGALLNMQGKLIGVNTLKSVGYGVEGMSFSIPPDTVTYALNQFEKNGKIIRGNLGVVCDESWEASVGLPTQKGLNVKTSSETQITEGDTIVSVNDITVHSKVELNEALKDTFFGGEIKVTLLHGGESKNVWILSK